MAGAPAMEARVNNPRITPAVHSLNASKVITELHVDQAKSYEQGCGRSGSSVSGSTGRAQETTAAILDRNPTHPHSGVSLIYSAGPSKMKFSPMIRCQDDWNNARPAPAGFVVFRGVFEVAEKR